jgi:hypothetical protein
MTENPTLSPGGGTAPPGQGAPAVVALRPQLPQLVATLVGGLAVLGAGVYLLATGHAQVGGALVVAGAGELGVKVATLL